MSEGGLAKTCRVCGKDVSQAKRVKGDEGFYYCPPCLDIWRKGGGKTAAVDAAPAPAAAPAAAASDDPYDLAPAIEAPKPARKGTVTSAPAEMSAERKAAYAGREGAAGKGLKLPKFCPNCDAAVLPNRRLCVKCNRDLTRMDKVIAMKAEGAKGPAKEDVIASWVGGVVKWGLIAAGVGVLVFGVWGVLMMMHPGGPYDGFPTKRAETVTQFFGHIAKGTPAEYEQAFYLISIRERMTNNANEVENYKRLFGKIHDELTKKHGADWISKMKVDREGGNDADEELRVTIGDAEYHVGTQAQMPADQAIANMATRTPPTYADGGKSHFGITEVAEFPLETKHRPGLGGGGE